jgi:hypothetical protein
MPLITELKCWMEMTTWGWNIVSVLSGDFFAEVSAKIGSVTTDWCRNFPQTYMYMYTCIFKFKSMQYKYVITLYCPFFSSVADCWADCKKVRFFQNLIFSAVRNFKFHHMFCRNTNFGQYWLSTVYFLGDFNETFRLLFCSCPSIDVPSFIGKYPKIKYAISDRPAHWRQLHLWWNIFFITEWIALKL